jgi:hypothetical protein
MKLIVLVHRGLGGVTAMPVATAAIPIVKIVDSMYGEICWNGFENRRHRWQLVAEITIDS